MAIGLTNPLTDWPEVVGVRGAALSTWLTEALCCAHQAVCGLRGHEMRVAFRPDRLFLRCARCGHASTGWEIRPPVRSTARIGSARRREHLSHAA